MEDRAIIYNPAWQSAAIGRDKLLYMCHSDLKLIMDILKININLPDMLHHTENTQWQKYLDTRNFWLFPNQSKANTIKGHYSKRIVSVWGAVLAVVEINYCVLLSVIPQENLHIYLLGGQCNSSHKYSTAMYTNHKSPTKNPKPNPTESWDELRNVVGASLWPFPHSALAIHIAWVSHSCFYFLIFRWTLISCSPALVAVSLKISTFLHLGYKAQATLRFPTHTQLL